MMSLFKILADDRKSHTPPIPQTSLIQMSTQAELEWLDLKTPTSIPTPMAVELKLLISTIT
jgi:hypothetical protein